MEVPGLPSPPSDSSSPFDKISMFPQAYGGAAPVADSVSIGEEVEESEEDVVREKEEVRGRREKVEEVGEELYVWPSGEVVFPEEMRSAAGEDRRAIV